MHGFFLVFHVFMGGVFAAGMTAAVFCWSRFFLSRDRSAGRSWGQRLLFFFFSWSGLFLILSALGMMMPMFTIDDQPTILALHRYSALISILSGVVLAYRLFREADDDGS